MEEERDILKQPTRTSEEKLNESAGDLQGESTLKPKEVLEKIYGDVTRANPSAEAKIIAKTLEEMYMTFGDNVDLEKAARSFEHLASLAEVTAHEIRKGAGEKVEEKK